MGRVPLAWCLVLCCWGCAAPKDIQAESDSPFVGSPGNITGARGLMGTLRCELQVQGEPPEVSWLRDGHLLELADNTQTQVPLGEDWQDDWKVISQLRISSLQLADAGQYQCRVHLKGRTFVSQPGYVRLEGLPYFLEEPEDKAVPANTPFNLSCWAQGPPEPVNLLWLRDAVPLVPATGHSSQYNLHAPGLLLPCQPMEPAPSGWTPRARWLDGTHGPHPLGLLPAGGHSSLLATGAALQAPDLSWEWQSAWAAVTRALPCPPPSGLRDGFSLVPLPLLTEKRKLCVCRARPLSK